MVKNGLKWSKLVKKNTRITSFNVQHIYELQNMSKQLHNIVYRSSLVQIIAEDSLKLPKTGLKQPKYKEKVHQ